MAGKHARLSPSNKTWPSCPGSVRECQIYPDIAGAAAIDGTGSHLLLEMSHGDKADKFLGKVIGVGHEDKPTGWLVAQDRIDRVNTALDYIERRKIELRELFGRCTVTCKYEIPMNPGLLFGKRDDWYGTSDVSIEVYDKVGVCLYSEVVDFKDGRGWVEVKNNSQLLSYMGGRGYVFPSGKDIPVRMTIVQPRTNPTVRYWDTTSSVVWQRCTELAKAAARTDDPNAPLMPDDKNGEGYCRWCKHRDNCKALSDLRTKGDEKEMYSISDINAMSNAELSEFLDTESAINDSFKYAKDLAKKKIEVGERVPGRVVEPGNKSKEWTLEEEDLVKYLRAKRLKDCDIYNKEVISPAQALKLDLLTDKQKKTMLTECIREVPGKPTLKKIKVEEEPAVVETDAFDALFQEPAEPGETEETDVFSFLLQEPEEEVTLHFNDLSLLEPQEFTFN